MVFAGLRTDDAKGRINAIGTDAAGDIYLAFDQGDGVRVLKVANDGGALLAQVTLGAAGDTAVALAVDPLGNVYAAGTSTSGTLNATNGAAFPAATAGTTNSFVAKFDVNLNETFLTFTGGTRIAASAIAASADSVFVTGIAYGSDLPVSATGVEPNPAFGSVQNGFVEAFSADGTTLSYATYITGAEGDTTPTGIAVDAGDDVWLVGSTTASGFPTIAAIVPEILSTPSGFLLQLTPAGDVIVYSTFIPGAGLSAVALDSTGLNLLLNGQVALGQFPVDTVESPLVAVAYQVLLRMSLDGSTVESGTVIAPGFQSVLTAASGGAAWVGGSFPQGTAPFLPQSALLATGNAYAVRVTPGNGIDQTVRFGGLANFDQAYASLSLGLSALAVDSSGALFVGGFAQPSASASLLSTITYDFPLAGTPTAALPSDLADAQLSSASCAGSLCSGSAGYLAKVDPVGSGPALAFSANAAPLVTLSNLGSASAQNLQLNATAGTLTTNCGSTLAPGAECDVLLAGGGAGTLSATDTAVDNAFVTFPAFAAGMLPQGIVYEPKELDFGIGTALSPAMVKTITVTNLTTELATFTAGVVGTPKSSSPFGEVSSDCTLAANPTQKVLAAGASCSIDVAFSPSSDPANDGFVQSDWTVASGQVLLTGYSQAASLSISATEIDFGTQFQGGLALPRYLYLSNASSSVQTHAAASLPAGSPFTETDGCPGNLAPHTVCRIRIDYQSTVAPSYDSETLTLDAGLAIVLTGTTMSAQTLGGSTLTSSLTASPSSTTFGNAVVVTGVSGANQTVSVTNGGTAVTSLGINISGDFSETSSCGDTLAAGASCTVVLTFTPSRPGLREGLLTLSAGAGNAPVTVALSGTGVGFLNENNGKLSFGPSPVGQPKIEYYKVSQSFDNLSLSTTGPYRVTLVEDNGFGYGDPPGSSYFTNGSGACHNCWVGVQFLPVDVGSQSGTLSFSSAQGGLPYVLQLTGSGEATSGLALSPSVSDFETIPVDSAGGRVLFSLTNLTSSGSAIVISSATISGDFALINPGGGSCDGILAYGASCAEWVQFVPTTTGSRSGLLSISTSAGTATASLSGTGTIDAGIALDPISLTFADIPGQTGQAKVVSVKNTSAQNVSIGTPLTISNNFSIDTACGMLAPAATCTIQVGFTPAATVIADVLSIPVIRPGSGGAQQTQIFQVDLSGTYTGQNAGLAIEPGTIAFGSEAAATASSPRQLTVTNLSAKQVAVLVTMPRSYALEGPGCSTLEANASCILTIVFAPLEGGDLPGTISVATVPSDASQGSSNQAYADGFGVGTGTLSVSGGLIVSGVFNFGGISVGQSSTQQFELTNSGTAAVTVRRVSTQAPFSSTTDCTTLLAPEATCSVLVTYSPAGSGSGISSSQTDRGSLTIESDAESSPNLVNLAGQPLAVVGSTGVFNTGSLSLSQGSLSFPLTTAGDLSASQSLVLTNIGNATVTVSSVMVPADFTIVNGCANLIAGGSCTISVASSPQSAGTHLEALEIVSTATTSLESVTLLGIGASSPLVFLPTSLSFGGVPEGATANLPLQVTNSGNTPVSFSNISTGANFSVTGNCPAAGGALASQASCTETISFAPSAPGNLTGVLAFETSASTGPLQVPLSGTGLQVELTALPTSLNFDSIVLGASANLTVKLSNQGAGSISGLSFAATGDYSVTSPCAGTTLAAGASCSVQVTFTPVATGTRTGSLRIVSSDPSSPLSVPLSGVGIANAGFSLTVNGGASATATVTSGNFVSFALAITPTGSFGGNVALTCTPTFAVPYASCALLPSEVNVGAAPQGSTATINTEEGTFGMGSLQRASSPFSTRTFLALLLPGTVLLWRRGRSLRRWLAQGMAVTGILLGILLSGCGGKSGGASGGAEHDTPPGTYTFQVTANSTSGIVETQTVSLSVVVTPR